jgi:hypothetical protein
MNIGKERMYTDMLHQSSGRLKRIILLVVIIMLVTGVIAMNRMQSTELPDLGNPRDELVNANLFIDLNTQISVTGEDDVLTLKNLASGVGWEFEPNTHTTNSLRKIGIKSIRHINVDIKTKEEGFFDREGRFIIHNPKRLSSELNTTRQIGATPYVVVGQSLHEDLIIVEENLPEGKAHLFMGLLQIENYGPNDYHKFEKYLEAVFEYVLITEKFSNARFIIGNEPDIGGSPHPFPPRPHKGSKELYDGYFRLYRSASNAARNVEERNPGVKVTLGGPALSMAYTFRYGDFNWIERFLKDIAEENLKLDFIDVHYYGNHSSLHDEYEANYPSLDSMLDIVFASRNLYAPGVPIWITEWGASYHTTNEEYSVINASNVGAAWSMEFLNAILERGVDGALYLVTTDLRRIGSDGKWENIWGWPSLFVNPYIFGRAYPTTMYHVFDMISQLQGQRILGRTDNDAIASFVTIDEQYKRIVALVWNYDFQILESSPGVEKGKWVDLKVHLPDVVKLSEAQTVQMKRWLISETISNAYHLYSTEGVIDSRVELQKVNDETLTIEDGDLAFQLMVPPSSVSLVVLDFK